MAENPASITRTQAVPRNGIARSMLAVTPSDTNELPPNVIGLFVNAGGTLQVQGVRNAVSVQLTVASSQYLLGQFQYVKATGTSATGIIAFIE